ncbi:MAG: hypothetical protein GX452_10070 [Ignavibacteriales bacterium]|jgi:hypothetical protein|nr:hypothetical protein [Ignavibacteriaceae bacterium]NLH61737.1 hypothetical protein [Ignavibacteriales bacterium]HOJ19692.1 hypothetical protein [Ignavibacteriaceae bacterium]HPO56572.1 hypothetical protein [Ignavibacteriaceae bacterium]
MAILIGSVLGNFRGRLGNICARINAGRTIFAALPSSFKDANTQEQQDYRSKLTTSAKFCSGINNNLTLRKLWKLRTPELLSPFNYMVKVNAKKVGLIAPTGDCLTSPPQGFAFTANSISVTESAVTATIPALETFLSLPPEASGVKFAGIVCYSDPLNEGMEVFVVTSLNKTVESYNFTTQYSLSIDLSPVQVALGAVYQKKTVFLGVIVTDESGNDILAHSDSVSEVL